MFSMVVRADGEDLLLTFDRGRDLGREGKATPLSNSLCAWHEGVTVFRVDESRRANSALIHGSDVYVRAQNRLYTKRGEFADFHLEVSRR